MILPTLLNDFEPQAESYIQHEQEYISVGQLA